MKIKDSTYTEINVAGTTSSDTGSFIFVNSSGTRYWSISSNSTNFFIADDNFSNYAYLSQNPTSWQFASDARLKENIADISYGIETIKQLQPRQFNFIRVLNKNILMMTPLKNARKNLLALLKIL